MNSRVRPEDSNGWCGRQRHGKRGGWEGIDDVGVVGLGREMHTGRWISHFKEGLQCVPKFFAPRWGEDVFSGWR